jgi:hypothetical protein
MPFETRVVATAPEQASTPLLAIALARGPLPTSLAALDAATDGALTRLLESGDFSGKKDELAMLYPTGSIARVLLVGLGKARGCEAGQPKACGGGRREAVARRRRA